MHLHVNLNRMKHDLDIRRSSEARDRNLSERNNSYVGFWSMFQIVVMVIVGAVQVFMLRSLFETDPRHNIWKRYSLLKWGDFFYWTAAFFSITPILRLSNTNRDTIQPVMLRFYEKQQQQQIQTNERNWFPSAPCKNWEKKNQWKQYISVRQPTTKEIAHIQQHFCFEFHFREVLEFIECKRNIQCTIVNRILRFTIKKNPFASDDEKCKLKKKTGSWFRLDSMLSNIEKKMKKKSVIDRSKSIIRWLQICRLGRTW